jgi:hypothetical protein
MKVEDYCQAFKPSVNMKGLSLGYSKNSSILILIIPSITLVLNLLYIFSYCRENSSNKNSK